MSRLATTLLGSRGGGRRESGRNQLGVGWGRAGAHRASPQRKEGWGRDVLPVASAEMYCPWLGPRSARGWPSEAPERGRLWRPLSETREWECGFGVWIWSVNLECGFRRPVRLLGGVPGRLLLVVPRPLVSRLVVSRPILVGRVRNRQRRAQPTWWLKAPVFD